MKMGWFEFSARYLSALPSENRHKRLNTSQINTNIFGFYFLRCTMKLICFTMCKLTFDPLSKHFYH